MSDENEEDPALAEARALAQIAVAQLGGNLETFTRMLGPDSIQQRIHSALTGPLPPPARVFRKGDKLDAGPIVEKINQQLSDLGWLKLFIQFVILAKEWTACASSPETENQ